VPRTYVRAHRGWTETWSVRVGAAPRRWFLPPTFPVPAQSQWDVSVRAVRRPGAIVVVIALRLSSTKPRITALAVCLSGAISTADPPICLPAHAHPLLARGSHDSAGFAGSSARARSCREHMTEASYSAGSPVSAVRSRFPSTGPVSDTVCFRSVF
jgi:hypothetical protein